MSPSRIQVFHAEVDSPAVVFEIAPGPQGEPRAEDALREFAIQLAKPASSIPRELAWHVAGGILKFPSTWRPPGSPPGRHPEIPAAQWANIVMPLHDGGRELLARLFSELARQQLSIHEVASLLTAVAQNVSSRRPDLWCAPDDPLTAVQIAHLVTEDYLGTIAIATTWEQFGLGATPESAVAALWALTRPGLARAAAMGASACSLCVDEAVLRTELGVHGQGAFGVPLEISDLQRQIFEVVRSSGVDPVAAFQVLDRDGDCLVSLADFASMLQELELPLSNVDLAMAAEAMGTGKCIDIAEFASLYQVWLERDPHLALPSPRQSPRLSRGNTFGPQLVEFLPPPACGSKCIALPSFVVFSFLDIHGKGHISEELMCCFGERCLGLSPESAANTAHMCDLIGRGAVSYRDFRRYFGHIDLLWCRRQTIPEREALSEFRANVRGVLEIVNQPQNAVTAKIIRPQRLAADTDAEGLLLAGPAQQPDREWRKSCHVIEDTLKRRGRHLNSLADAAGLAELFSDLRVPADVAVALFEWHAVLGQLAAQAVPEDTDTDVLQRLAAVTYEDMLYSLRRALARLRTHLDGLFGGVLLANVNLSEVLDSHLRQPGQMIALCDLETALRKAGVDLSTVDIEDVLRVLDPSHRRCIFAPELLAGYDAFRRRHGTILGKLADNLSRSGLSTDELFARASHFPTGLPATAGA